MLIASSELIGDPQNGGGQKTDRASNISFSILYLRSGFLCGNGAPLFFTRFD
jgi:hypothetical protein